MTDLNAAKNRYYQVKLIVKTPDGTTDADAAVAAIGLMNLSLGHGWVLLGPAREAVDVTDRVSTIHADSEV